MKCGINMIKLEKQLKINQALIFIDNLFLKAKVREFDGMIKTNFLVNNMPKENMHYTCIAYITIDSVLTIDKKNHPQVYLEECKYKVKKIQMSRFINTELKSDSESGLDSDLEKIDAKIDNKLESGSDPNKAFYLYVSDIFNYNFTTISQIKYFN